MKVQLSFCRRLARWWPATTTRRALAVCSIFGVLLLASAYAATEYTALFGDSGSAGASGKGAHAGAAELPADDPAAHFSDTGVGQVLFSSARNDSCRRVLFDNRTGTNYESKDVACGPRPEPVVTQPPEPAPNRLTAVRKSFQR